MFDSKLCLERLLILLLYCFIFSFLFSSTRCIKPPLWQLFLVFVLFFLLFEIQTGFSLFHLFSYRFITLFTMMLNLTTVRIRSCLLCSTKITIITFFFVLFDFYNEARFCFAFFFVCFSLICYRMSFIIKSWMDIFRVVVGFLLSILIYSEDDFFLFAS